MIIVYSGNKTKQHEKLRGQNYDFLGVDEIAKRVY
jgi:hypothetical protein